MSENSNKQTKTSLSVKEAQELSSAYGNATFEFYNAYSDGFQSAIDSGIEAQQAAVNGLEAGNKAASQSFLEAYSSANTNSNLSATYAEASQIALDRAEALKLDTRSAKEVLADYSKQASTDFTNIFGNNPYIKVVAKYGGNAGDIIDVGGAIATGDSGDVTQAFAAVAAGSVGAYVGVALAATFSAPFLAAAAIVGLTAGLAGLIPGQFGNEDGQDDFWDVIGDSVFEVTDAIGYSLGNLLYDLKQDIDQATHTAFQAALNWVRPIRRDPLVLDLDGDGIETTPADGSVLFDHNADGQKTGTGWVAADDGLLVLDRNGNGTIDTGRELFGDNTLKLNGELAQNGFDALIDLDTNADGLIDANDADFANLRIWQDLNQDGISQSNELKTLDQLNIKNISLANQNNSHNDYRQAA